MPTDVQLERTMTGWLARSSSRNVAARGPTEEEARANLRKLIATLDHLTKSRSDSDGSAASSSGDPRETQEPSGESVTRGTGMIPDTAK